jgi:LmbE family N-acetylglucosaminyl deacetylase
VKDGLRVGHGRPHPRRDGHAPGTPETRKKEAQNAAKALGATFRQQLDFQDGNLQDRPGAGAGDHRAAARPPPALVVVSYPDDRHPDHSRTGRVVTEASFYAG